ncbi:MAG: hypothetical protein J6B75_03460 [Ruminococcus sp.]|nr:hypothetical protein [Ruminococcus sp.]
MKKILTFMTSVCLAASVVPFSASAAEYEKYPNAADFNTNDEYYQELSDGIKDGRYFADFDGNGTFDVIDAVVIMYYISNVMTDNTPVVFEGRQYICSFSQNYRYSCIKNYELVERDGMYDCYLTLNNDMLENIEKYGDIDNDGDIDGSEIPILMCAYGKGFERGDVDYDGSVDASDASYVLGYYSNCQVAGEISEVLQRDMLEHADMNGDSSVDAVDASLILKAYAESSTS